MTLIVNDLHLGVQRKGGTTPASQEALRNYLFKAFEELLMGSQERHLLILGDLFDQFEVAPRDWIACYLILSNWCTQGRGLTLVAGNHDHSPKAQRVSSFEMLCKVLVEQFGPDRVQVVGIDQWSYVEKTTIALAHCSNQDIFNAKLSEVHGLMSPLDKVLLHANYNNQFAVESDHSLNVSEDQARSFNTFGATLYFAHEHQARTLRDGGVVVFGNQWPTSVADCLNNDAKYAHIFTDDGIVPVLTWRADDEICEGSMAAGHCGFGQVKWTDLGDFDANGAQFIRIVGEATAAQAGEVINAISKFRTRSSAFVITNAVRIDGVMQTEDLPATFEAAKRFDVMEFIRRHVTAEEFVVVEGLLQREEQ